MSEIAELPDAENRRRRRLGEILVDAGVITDRQLSDALLAQSTQPVIGRQRLGNILVDHGVLTERELAQALGTALGTPTMDLASTAIDPVAARLVPRTVADKYCVLGVQIENGRLTLAMADPTDVMALDDVRAYSKVRSVRAVAATESAIRTHLNRVWSLEGDSTDVVTTLEGLEAVTADDDETVSEIDETPVVKLVNVILSDAVRASASDIHLEPERQALRVRYRVDGLLRDVMTVPKTAQNTMTSRVKILSGIDIAERRRPQDGRMRITVDDQIIDCRVSTLPTVHGEKVVIRLLTRAEGVVPLARIGLAERQLDALLDTLVAPQGLVLITGPTGSGKTSTLYSCLAQIRTPDRNLVTLEDPVEMQLPGVNQVQINDKAGLTFAAALRSVLRQDPDVVLVGEIRDTETAELALRASLTGHLVFSTLHTNDASAAVTRLVDMGVEPFLIASSLTLVLAQRLVRTPCPSCAAPYEPSPRTLQLLGLVEDDLVGGRLLRGRGCDECGDTGYRGRAGIFEVVPVDEAMRQVLTKQGTESAIRAAARRGGALSLRQDGIARSLRGETTLEEILRVTQMDAASGPRCPGCHRALGDDMVLCPFCGTDVEVSSCESCQRHLEPEWRHCPFCKAPVSEARRMLRLGITDTGQQSAHILVVDDDASVRSYVEVALADVGSVQTCGTAQEAQRHCSSEEVDLVILDLHLPDLSGIELTRLLRSDPRTALIPVLILTGSQNATTLAEARRAGADDVLGKPVDPDQLEVRVKRLLAKHATASSTPG